MADDVTSRFDPRLTRIASVLLEGRRRGVMKFRVPAVAAGDYAFAYWCRFCSPRGSFVSFTVDHNMNRYFAPHMVPRIRSG